jgi:signal transduction histidine kinase
VRNGLVSKTQTTIYVAVVASCFAAAMTAGWSSLARRIDNSVYDQMTRWSPPETGAPESVVVAIDGAALEARGGMRQIRSILAGALDQIASAQPKAVGIDVILHDRGDDAEDGRLEASMRATHNLVLACPWTKDHWERPLPRFAALAAALGEVDLEPDRLDGVGRQIPMEVVGAGERHWALSLEALRLAHGVLITESPEDLEVGGSRIPAPRTSTNGRALLIRFQPEGVPLIPLLTLGESLDRLRGKTVFLGVTALAAGDRLLDPYGSTVAGVAVHADAYETMARGKFLTPANDTLVLLTCIGFAVAAGLIFRFLGGWWAYGAILPLLALVLYLPVETFRYGVIFPLFAPAAVAWLCSAGAATYQYLFVRRQLRRSESEKSRYQQAIHWAAHEMRTPLTAIQGSSEIMTRYSLPDAKRHQLSEMINSESKRLSRIIQTFLDVERLADGQMELKREPMEAADVVDSCMRRVTPIAANKRIKLTLDNTVEGVLLGDRELMEYAFYNLLTNAVKYSPADTEVHVFSDLAAAGSREGELKLAVRDQGIGMDSKELKQIFRKFYRTKRAEASGEVGTGIGLSIVEQIVSHHGGRIDVTSTPGKGSCFTMALKTLPVTRTSAGLETPPNGVPETPLPTPRQSV